jgi:hypothetical protein
LSPSVARALAAASLHCRRIRFLAHQALKNFSGLIPLAVSDAANTGSRYMTGSTILVDGGFLLG